MATASNGFTHQVMNCQDYKKEYFPSCGMAAGPKLDGVRGYYYPGQDYLFSRQNKMILGMSHIVRDLRLRRVKYPVDMELYVPGMEFNEISGLVRNHDNTPQVQGHIIDMVVPSEFIAERLKRRPNETDNVFHIPHYVVRSHEAFMARHKGWLKMGYEGTVGKKLRGFYRTARTRDWLREVPVKSEDCRCLGVYEGRGKMQGIAGGIWIDFNGIECKCGTLKDFTYEDRRQLLENEDHYIGMVMEVQYKNLQPSGKPRQPRGKGWRYDKS